MCRSFRCICATWSIAEPKTGIHRYLEEFEMSEQSRNRVGVIGLGAMGMGVAQSLLRAGFEVHACDLRQDAVQKVVDAGGRRADSPAALGSVVDTLILLVVNADQTEGVLFGEQGAAARLAPGSV